MLRALASATERHLGQTIVIDTYARTVQIAGVSVSQRLQVRQWTPLQPGSSKILFTAAAYDPAPRMRVRVRDAVCWLFSVYL